MLKSVWLAAIAVGIDASGRVAGIVPAFPGAMGFGSSASGGRGGAIYTVTTLADVGPGSFRDAVSQPNRTVIFSVGGYVNLSTAVSVASDITIAGQTAPGGGIGVSGRELSLSGSSNVIIRGLRVRQGSRDPDRGKSAVNIGKTSNLMLDHISVAFGSWDSVDAVGAVNFTVSNCIIADPIGQQFGAHVEAGPGTFFANLFVNAHNRQPLAKANIQFINNIVYDFEAGFTAGNTGGNFTYDVLSNFFMCGPMTSASGGDAYFQVPPNEAAYSVGNVLGCARDGTLSGVPHDAVGSAASLLAPWAPSTSTFPVLEAAAAYVSSLASAGAFPRDEVDNLVARDVASLGKQGMLYKTQESTGLSNDGYGVIASGDPLPDTAGSGIPDFWAVANGISTSDQGAGSAAYGSSGYTNIEAFVNSLILPALWVGADLGKNAPSGVATFNALNSTAPWLLAAGSAGYAATVTANASTPRSLIATLQELYPLTASSGLILASMNVTGSLASALAYCQLTWTASNGTVALTAVSGGVPLQQRTGVGFDLPLTLRLGLGADGGCAGSASEDQGSTWTDIGMSVVMWSSSQLIQAGIMTMATDASGELAAAAISRVYGTSSDAM